MSSPDIVAVSPARREEPPACVCGSRRYRTLFDATFDRVHVRLLPYSVVECGSCGLARTFPVPEGDRYGEAHAGPTSEGTPVGFPEDTLSAERASWIAARAPGPRLLDVGCNGGNLVAATAELGLDAEGIDPDPVATEWGRRLGRRLHTGTLDALDGRYDVVVLAHVLEHVVDPGGILREVARLMAPHGRAFVFVPNRSGLVPGLMHERWMGWVPSEHVWHFTPATLRRTVEAVAPLRVVACTTRGVLEPPSAGVKGAAKAGVTAAARLLRRGDQIEAVLERSG